MRSFFFTHILPYRIANEPLEFLMNTDFGIDPGQLHAQLKNSHGSLLGLHRFYFSELLPSFPNRLNLPYPVQSESYVMDCLPHALFMQIGYRLLGIPCTIDFTPFWSRADNGHHWNSVINYHTPEERINENNTAQSAKVYRNSFTPNPIPAFNGYDFIPPLFRDPFVRDVTEKYCRVADITIGLGKNKAHASQDIYLCVFNKREWQPIACSRSRKKSVTFKNVGIGNIYLPIIYEGIHKIPVSYPFEVLENGELRILEPSPEVQSLTLTRKYPVSSFKMKWDRNMSGVQLWGYQMQGGPGIFLAEIDDLNEAPFFDLDFMAGQWKYLKISANPDYPYKPINIAEISFWNSENQEIDFKQLILLDKQTTRSEEVREKISDKNVLSYFDFYDHLIFTFEENRTIQKIKLISRNDDNYITPGDDYELLYFSPEGWVSLEFKKATERKLEFDQVPVNALFWLRNISKGREERIFTYESGSVVFW